MADLASSMHASLEVALGTDEVIQGTTVYDYELPLESMGNEYYIVDLVSLVQNVAVEIDSTTGVIES